MVNYPKMAGNHTFLGIAQLRRKGVAQAIRECSPAITPTLEMGHRSLPDLVVFAVVPVHFRAYNGSVAERSHRISQRDSAGTKVNEEYMLWLPEHQDTNRNTSW